MLHTKLLLTPSLMVTLALTTSCVKATDGCARNAVCNKEKDKTCDSKETVTLVGLEFKHKLKCGSNGRREIQSCDVDAMLSRSITCEKNTVSVNCDDACLAPGDVLTIRSKGPGQVQKLGSLECTEHGIKSK